MGIFDKLGKFLFPARKPRKPGIFAIRQALRLAENRRFRCWLEKRLHKIGIAQDMKTIIRQLR